MITMNEEMNIARALSSCTFADEIVVVDGGSNDRTIDILNSNDRVKLIRHPWEGHFGNQRELSLRNCTGDWVVRLDADEAYSGEFEEKIRGLLESAPPDVAGYKIRQCNLVGDDNYYSKLYDNFESIPRIWRNVPGVRWEGEIHEILTGFSGRTVEWDMYVVHYGFLDKGRYSKKSKSYSHVSGSGVDQAEKLVFREYDFRPRPQRTMAASHVIPYKMDKDTRRKPAIGIVRGPNLTSWELQNYSPLLEKFDITAYATDQASFEMSDVKVPVVSLPYNPKNPTCLTGLEFALFDKDIIYTSDITWYFTYQAVMAKQKFGKKVIALEWENIPFAYEEDAQMKDMKERSRMLVDIFVTVTERAKEALLLEGVDKEKIVVIPMGVDVKRLSPDDAERERLRKEFGIEDKERIVLFAGRLVWEKGIYDLLHAAKLIEKQAAAENDIAQMFTFYPRHNMFEILRAADIFVMPSISTRTWQEQSGMILIQAMACGVPVISTLTGSIPEVVDNAGILVQPNDPRELSASIMKLLLDDNLRKELGARGRKRALERFDSENTASKFGTLFERVYDSSRS
jgi:glycosyltransferase involved in cell wall biosynthesis